MKNRRAKGSLAFAAAFSLFWFATGTQAQTVSPSWKADWERVVDTVYLSEFQGKGVGLTVKPLAPDTPAGGTNRIGPGFGNLMLVNRAPHPNAAKVFNNWLLSRDGQVAYVKSSQINSRRLDVSGGPAEMAPKRGVKYININKEELNPYQNKAIAIGKEILK